MKHAPSSRPAHAGPSRRGHRRPARAPERGRVVYGGSRVEEALAKNQPAFTLAEILIALALILIVGGLAAANMFNIASSVDKAPPQAQLMATVRECRFLAMARMQPVILSFNGDTYNFDILDDTGIVLDSIPSNADPGSANLTVTFTSIKPMNDLGTSFESTMDNPDLVKDSSSRLLFHPSGATALTQVDMTVGTTDDKFVLDSFSEGPTPKVPESAEALIPGSP